VRNSDRRFEVLLVCTGNTCRSAMAQGIAKKISSEKGIDQIIFSSAGTSAANGMPATEYAIAASAHWDIDISGHRARTLKPEHVKNADLILVMAPEHARAVLSYDKRAFNKLYLYKGFPEPFNQSQERVEDPIGGTMEMYNQTFLELEEVMRRIFPHILKLAKEDV
jgi:protein-tyrosine-phosphatase